ncbi:TniB family NTP-binding protein [uncultured Psychrobacillus sp.]|uniref:TniB family NTP-binding protein n=1 Tax=uncultured Psychrobacillus sp. TaxID=1551585 RepID=UPI002612A869|nr:TniB family NTP-binding protein [uncultured Psychrobacillus sp.]
MTTKDDITLLTKEEKLKKIDILRIAHPEFKKALELIRMCHATHLNYSEPQCLLITGNYGTGKSSIMEIYLQKHQKIIPLERTTKVAILAGDIRYPTTINTFLESMLYHLGDSHPTKGTIGNKQHRLIKFISDSEVELIMLDEFQHFVNRDGNDKINHSVADCLKSIINSTKVPVVLIGMDESELVLKANGQLKRRFSFRHHLNSFNCVNAERTDYFRLLLNNLDEKLPFKNLAGLKEHGMWEKFNGATNGNMNSLMKIVRTAAKYAVEAEQEKIEMEHFSKAFELHISIMNGANPFK